MYMSACACVHIVSLFQILTKMDKLCGVGSVVCMCTCSGSGRLMCACRKVSMHLCSMGVG